MERWITGIAIDNSSNLYLGSHTLQRGTVCTNENPLAYIFDVNYLVIKITPSGEVSSLAGNGTTGMTPFVTIRHFIDFAFRISRRPRIKCDF